MKTKINENQKVTLTLGQLKKLVKEGLYGPYDLEYEQYGDYDDWAEYGRGHSSDFSPMSLYREVKSCINTMGSKEPTMDEIVKELKKDENGYTVDIVRHNAKCDVIAVKNEYDEYCKVEIEFDPYDWFVERLSKQAYNRLIKTKSVKTRIDENQKITLTVGQLKRLVKESFNEGPWAERDEIAYEYKSYVPDATESPLDAGFYFKDEDDAYDFGIKARLLSDETSHVRRNTVNGIKYWVVYFY